MGACRVGHTPSSHVPPRPLRALVTGDITGMPGAGAPSADPEGVRWGPGFTDGAAWEPCGSDPNASPTLPPGPMEGWLLTTLLTGPTVDVPGPWSGPHTGSRVCRVRAL